MSTITDAPTHGHPHPPMTPRMYLIIYGALMSLMALTLLAALFDLGAANFLIAMGIATVKMSLIILYFMHVRYNEKLTWIFSTAALFWLLILIIGTLNDYFTRGVLDVPGK
jgi:cytochrome c oxidase subunit IV